MKVRPLGSPIRRFLGEEEDEEEEEEEEEELVDLEIHKTVPPPNAMFEAKREFVMVGG